MMLMAIVHTGQATKSTPMKIPQQAMLAEAMVAFGKKNAANTEMTVIRDTSTTINMSRRNDMLLKNTCMTTFRARRKCPLAVALWP